jgi:hypothetical protein
MISTVCDGNQLDSAGSWYDPALRSCENENEPSVSVQGGEFIVHLRENHLLKKNSAAWDRLVKTSPRTLTVQRAMKAHWDSGSIAPHILDLGTRLR